MNKCFEGIERLEFDDQKKIHGMYSSMGEYIQFLSVIDPLKRQEGQEISTEVRNVEDWLFEVETQMKDSLRSLIRKSGEAYGDGSTRGTWIFGWAS